MFLISHSVLGNYRENVLVFPSVLLYNLCFGNILVLYLRNSQLLKFRYMELHFDIHTCLVFCKTLQFASNLAVLTCNLVLFLFSLKK
jgi:hypothetical protein